MAYRALACLLLAAAAIAQQPKQPPTPAQTISRSFAYVNGKILEMARDFPEDKYGYRLTKDTRSFAEQIIHVVSGNVYAGKSGRGEKVNWDELDAKNYRTKADVVAALQKSIDDANATLRATPEDRFLETLQPWMSVIEHAAEHYGVLVAYYRVNGLVPPDSRPKK